MLDAGGWQSDTLTEDLDLSYRAQLLKFLWQAPQPVWLKLMGTLHLTNYAVHPLMLLNLLLTLPIALSDSPFLFLTPLFLFSAIGPPLLYWTAMQAKSIPLFTRLGRLALLIAVGTGLSLNNTRAVLEALLNIKSEFKRTPKFAITPQFKQWQISSYALPRDPVTWLELALALYAWGLLGWIISWGMWWLMPWLLLYVGGYSYISGLAFVQAWETRVARGVVTERGLSEREKVSA